MDKRKKATHMSPNKPSINKKVTREDRKEISQLIIKHTDDKARESRFSDRQLDRKQEIYELLSGAKVSITEIEDLMKSTAQEYDSVFPQEYYKQLYRLNGWPMEEAAQYFKRREIAVFTNEGIYGRFDKTILLSMRVLNPYVGYISRRHKHYQFLSPQGLKQLSEIIDEAVALMKDCTTYYEFRKRYFVEYEVPYQIKMFGE